MTWIIIIGLSILTIWLLHKFKIIKIGATAIFTGAPKTGKSTIAVWISYIEHRKQLIKTKLYNIFHKKKKELPLWYSNIPIKDKYYAPLTKELITRKERFRYGSVIYAGEFSLIADSMEFKDQELNEKLQLFAKLIGHETKGGKLILDTQCIADCHYAIKRVIGQYYYIHDTINRKLLPFVIMHIREQVYSDDNSTINSINSDVENDLKSILIPKFIWKKFDCYCYSTFTDNLRVSEKTEKVKDLKAHDIISFKTWKTIDIKNIGGKKNENSIKMDNK